MGLRIVRVNIFYGQVFRDSQRAGNILTSLRTINYSRVFMKKVMSMAKRFVYGEKSFARHRNIHVGFELRASALKPSGAVI
jgi:hypothetical protein